MDSLSHKGFEEQLGILIDKSDREKEERDRLKKTEQELYQAKLAKFREVAGKIKDEIIIPKMEKLKEYFPFIEEPDLQPEWGRLFLFPHVVEYPCRSILDIHVLPTAEGTQLSCVSHITIVPKSEEYEPHETLAQPLEDIDLKQVEQFVEEKILGFVDIYLKYRRI